MNIFFKIKAYETLINESKHFIYIEVRSSAFFIKDN